MGGGFNCTGSNTEEEAVVKMADNSNTDRTEDDNMDNTVASGGSMMVITVKTPNGKEDISISEDSSVSEVTELFKNRL